MVRRVPFDNVLKLIHLAEERPGPLPGSTAESFFEAWLEHGTGGTCWSGNGALHGLLEALGFDVARVIATMLSSPRASAPNHGSVLATVDGERWLVDASILCGSPIRIPDAGEPGGEGPLPRFNWLDGRPAVLWRTASAPEGFHCRIERIGADADRVGRAPPADARRSPFNYQLNARLLEARRASASRAGSGSGSTRTARVSPSSSTARGASGSSSRSSASPSGSPCACPAIVRCRRAPIVEVEAQTRLDRSSRPRAGRVAPRLSPTLVSQALRTLSRAATTKAAS